MSKISSLKTQILEKEHLNKCNNIQRIRILIIIRSFLPILTYRFSAIPIKISAGCAFVCGSWQDNLKIIWKFRGKEQPSQPWKIKREHWLYWILRLIKISKLEVRCWSKDRQIDQWDGIESRNWPMDIRALSLPWRSSGSETWLFFSTWCWVNCICIWKN